MSPRLFQVFIRVFVYAVKGHTSTRAGPSALGQSSWGPASRLHRVPVRVLKSSMPITPISFPHPASLRPQRAIRNPDSSPHQSFDLIVRSSPFPVAGYRPSSETTESNTSTERPIAGTPLRGCNVAAMTGKEGTYNHSSRRKWRAAAPPNPWKLDAPACHPDCWTCAACC
jgi:hypothetical protein